MLLAKMEAETKLPITKETKRIVCFRLNKNKSYGINAIFDRDPSLLVSFSALLANVTPCGTV